MEVNLFIIVIQLKNELQNPLPNVEMMARTGDTTATAVNKQLEMIQRPEHLLYEKYTV